MKTNIPKTTMGLSLWVKNQKLEDICDLMMEHPESVAKSIGTESIVGKIMQRVKSEIPEKDRRWYPLKKRWKSELRFNSKIIKWERNLKANPSTETYSFYNEETKMGNEIYLEYLESPNCKTNIREYKEK